MSAKIVFFGVVYVFVGFGGFGEGVVCVWSVRVKSVRNMVQFFKLFFFF